MLKGEDQVKLATLRMQLRAIDAEIESIRRESRRYRQMRFGLDIKEIQLTALQDQRAACHERIIALTKRLQLHPARRNHPLAWLLVPVALWQNAQRSLIMTESNVPERPEQNVGSFHGELTAVGAGQ